MDKQKQPLEDAPIYNPTDSVWIATRNGDILGVFTNEQAALDICEINATWLDTDGSNGIEWTTGVYRNSKQFRMTIVDTDDLRFKEGDVVNFVARRFFVAETFHYYD